jgi:glycerophosphoryl diester phosphodiesterase
MTACIGQATGLPDASEPGILLPDTAVCWIAVRQRRSPLLRILGHRGARLVAPENTLPAFRAAIAEGADGVELDIRRTADQALVCLHDAGLGRTTSGRGPVRQHTLAEIRGLDAGTWFQRNGHARHARGARTGKAGKVGKAGKAGKAGKVSGVWRDGAPGVRVPTLSEALDAMPRRALVDVEVKFRGEGPDGAARVAELLGEVLAGRPDRDRILVSSFSRKLAAAAVPALGGIDVGLISSALVPIGRALRAAEECGCTVLAVQAPAFFGPMGKLAAARALDAGLRLLAWTVDDAETARRLADLGVEVIVSDRPGQLRRMLDAGGNRAD